MDRSMTLPAVMDSPGAAELAERLMAVRGASVQLDGGEVTFAGALALQVLVSARRQWSSDDMPFELVSPSDAFRESCRLLGIEPADLGVAAEDTEAAT